MPEHDGEFEHALTDSGLRYCTTHHGVIECDEGEGPCDFLDQHDPEHACPTCSGTGVDPADDAEQCQVCGGEGLTACTSTPLLYEAALSASSEPVPPRGTDMSRHSDEIGQRLNLWLVTINDAPMGCGFCAEKVLGSGTGTVHDLLNAIDRHAGTCKRGLSHSSWSCPKCGSGRWVSASLTGPVSHGGRAIKQCVPCGHYSDDPVAGSAASEPVPPGGAAS